MTLTLRYSINCICGVISLKMLIKEFADLAGVSVRTLHYYDDIGLLKPSCVDKNTGYRYYDEKSLIRMQEILFFRELDFSLKSIGEILSSPDYDKNKALKEQKQLLTIKKERLEKLIIAIDNAAKGENIMKTFDNSEFEKYKAEAKKKWGDTAAFDEYEKRINNNNAAAADKMMDIFCRMGKIKDSSPNGGEAKALVAELKKFICENYYTCTDEILSGLGKMYIGDSRFTENIDKAGGTGTAAFAAKAIEEYCKK